MTTDQVAYLDSHVQILPMKEPTMHRLNTYLL